MSRETELLVRVNGIQPAYGIEYGLSSPRSDEIRAGDVYRQANASYSLLQRERGRFTRHTVIDVGMGVVPSLMELEATHGVHVVDEVLISHPHFDHYGGLHWLAASIRRNGRPEQPRPLPVYASQECWERGPNAVFPLVCDWSDGRVKHFPLVDRRAVSLGELEVTPFRVIHGSTAPGAMGFVAALGRRKVIVTCDFLTIPNVEDPLFAGATVCFMESNTWHPAPDTGHQSITDGLRLISQWRPKRTYLMHYSGLEDRKREGGAICGPLSRDRLRVEIAAVRGTFDVVPATHGMILGEDESWPE